MGGDAPYPLTCPNAVQAERCPTISPVRRTTFIMTSEERHQARYDRRKRRREEKRRAAIAEYDDFDRLCSCNALFKAARLSGKSIRWKASVQRYYMSWLRNVINLRTKLTRGDDVTMGFIEFELVERGKKRHIRSVHFKERVAQRSLCDNALVPVLSRSLIYDNGASLEGKGITFARNRLKHHLHQFYRRTGSNEGYVLLMDFSGYFDSILHEPIYETLDRAFDDKRITALCRQFIEPFGAKGLGIGSQVSQILAISYRSSIDHYIKEVLRIREYGCYMDDCYLIHESKEYLWYCLSEIEKLCAAKGIRLNRKKTQIVKLPHGFPYMKGVYYLTGSGRLIVKPSKDNCTRHRRKLKKLKRFLEDGSLSLEQIACAHNSYRGYIQKDFDSHRTVRNMDKLFHELYGYATKINSKERF